MGSLSVFFAALFSCTLFFSPPPCLLGRIQIPHSGVSAPPAPNPVHQSHSISPSCLTNTRSPSRFPTQPPPVGMICKRLKISPLRPHAQSLSHKTARHSFSPARITGARFALFSNNKYGV